MPAAGRFGKGIRACYVGLSEFDPGIIAGPALKTVHQNLSSQHKIILYNKRNKLNS